jgi:hypothetical protein
MIYTADHPPPHVHVVGPGWVVVVDLDPIEVRAAKGCSNHQAGDVKREIAAHREALLESWRRLHE